MRHAVRYLFMALFITISSNAIANNAPKQLFSIQIGSFSNPKVEQFKKLSNVGVVFLEDVKNKKLKRVLLGKYKKKTTARSILKKVKAAGFKEAFIAPRKINVKSKVYVVQLASYKIKDLVDLSLWKDVKPLYIQPVDNQVKLLVGTYPNLKAVNTKLQALRKAGHTKVFIKQLNTAWIHKLNSFEKSYLTLEEGKNVLKKPQPVVSKPPAKPKSAPKPKKPNTTSTTQDEEIKEGSLFPEKYATKDVVNVQVVKRVSVEELQKVLKSAKTYSGSIDGLFGDATRKSISLYRQQDKRYQRYFQMAGKKPKTTNEDRGLMTLQDYIDFIDINAKLAEVNLKKFKTPIADAYLAYIYFTKKVDILNSPIAVNNLMNDAIQRTFKDYKGQTKLDYKSTYSYQDLEQLLSHLAYIHEATKDAPAIPCWMVENHGEKVIAAFTGLKTPKFAACGNFSDWREARTLMAMAEDLDPKSDAERGKKGIAEKQGNITRRIQLYLSPKKLSTTEAEIMESWHKNLWKALETWAKKDPLHRKMITALKVSYYITFDKLENHYSQRGFEPTAARGLALTTLRTMVGYHLGGYLTK